MAAPKDKATTQYGDFQTPPELAVRVCQRLAALGINPTVVIEPTCGRGNFVAAAVDAFPGARVLGLEINAAYAAEASRAIAHTRGEIRHGDFFQTDWKEALADVGKDCLVLGNPPWVTNAEIGGLGGTNLPQKSNFQKHQGLDALTGKANFDISESMLTQQICWLQERSGWIAMLVKTAVARKVLRQVWKNDVPVGRAAIYKIDALESFGAAVDACLFVLPVAPEQCATECDIFASLDGDKPSATIGFHRDILVSDNKRFKQWQQLLGRDTHHVWRSGIKHDCARVMELVRSGAGWVNGLNETVRLEDQFLFPLFKSSDVAKGRRAIDRAVIVPQRAIGDKTDRIEADAPRTWEYLCRHQNALAARRSTIYRNKPRFSIFGVGAYTFTPWKIAVSGLYKNLHFVKYGPVNGRPVVFDDTVYFLPCHSEAEADCILSLVTSKPFTQLLQSMTFSDDKRPVTAELLKRISLEAVATALGKAEQYDACILEPGFQADQKYLEAEEQLRFGVA